MFHHGALHTGGGPGRSPHHPPESARATELRRPRGRNRHAADGRPSDTGPRGDRNATLTTAST
jgi:hypothetical protein